MIEAVDRSLALGGVRVPLEESAPLLPVPS
jgi:hypothetical protein